jgi:uncharacterized membrane protein YgcG
MAKINPNEHAREDSGTGGGGDRPREVGPGRKVLLPIGMVYDEINDKRVIRVRSVCLVDLEGTGDEGAALTDTFWLSSAALWRVANFALAVGYSEPFDPEVAEEMDAVLASGPYEATISITQRGGKSYPNAGAYKRTDEVGFDEVSGDLLLTQRQQEAVANAEASWEGFLRWFRSNRRGGSSGGGGRSSGGGGRSSGGGNGGRRDDEIPF